jgi:hypothetical protein
VKFSRRLVYGCVGYACGIVGVSAAYAQTQTDMSVALAMPEKTIADAGINNTEKQEKSVVNSLLFSSTEMSEIRLAINTYIKNMLAHQNESIDEEDFLNQLTGIKKNKETSQAAKYYTYPQFFLQSIVYHSPQDWSIWINNRKITPNGLQDPENIRVIGIDRDKADIEWRPAVMEKVNRAWDNSSTSAISVDKKNGIVTFSLRPNQTFSSYVMRVVEGKVLPVTEGNQIMENAVLHTAIAKEAEKKNLNAKSSVLSPAKPAEHEGLGGLLDKYHDMKNGENP